MKPRSFKFGYYVFINLSDKSSLAKDIGEDGELMGQIVDELEARNYVTKNHETFSLTLKGLKAGTSSWWSKLIIWLNLNPGVATVIALVALGVSIFSLIVSMVKP